MKSRLLLTTAVLAAASSAAFAEDIRTNARNLDDAIARAQPGDRVLVRERIRGEVEVMSPGITIVGRAGATMTGDLVVLAQDVTVEGMKFKNASVVAWEDGTTVRNDKFVRAQVELHGDGSSATGNVFDGKTVTSQAIAVDGNDAVVTGNSIRRYAEAIHVDGDGSVVSDNAIGALDGAAVRVNGNEATIEDNVFSNEVRDAFIVDGDSATIVGNELQVSESGISVHGDGAVIGGNTVTGDGSFTEDGVFVVGDEALVQGNTVSGLSGGVFVDGDQATISDNGVVAQGDLGGIVVVETEGSTVSGNVVDALTWSGVFVQGEQTLVEGNDVSGTALGTGVVVAGTEMTVTDNTVAIAQGNPYDSGFGNDAIGVYGDLNEVTGNDVTGSLGGGSGVRVEGDVNVVEDNTAGDIQNGYGVTVAGDDNLGVENDVEDVEGEGIVISGDGNVIDGSDTANITSCGFLVLGPTRIENCTAANCGMGIVNIANGTQIVDSTINQNAPYDLVDLGDVTNTSGSTLGGVYDDPNQFPGFQEMEYIPYGAPTLMWRPSERWLGANGGTITTFRGCAGLGD